MRTIAWVEKLMINCGEGVVCKYVPRGQLGILTLIALKTTQDVKEMSGLA